MKAPSVGILIPALNEERTIANIVRVAVAANIGEVLVVSDGSTDNTAGCAQAAGARVLQLQKNLGKGGAVAAGIQEMSTDLVLMLDADLLGLTEKHLTDLLTPVLSKSADTSVGILRGGRSATDLGSQLTPQLSGQRVISRQTLGRIGKLEDRHYAIELAINDQIRCEKLRLHLVHLDGVTQIMKEEKLGLLRGSLRRIKMYWQIIGYAVFGRKQKNSVSR